MTDLRVFPSLEATADAAADLLAADIRAAREARGAAHVALAGGNTPKAAYAQLGDRLGGDWSGVHLWFGDERAVGPDDPDSNYLMAVDALKPSDQVTWHRVLGEEDPETAAAAYAEELRSVLPAGDDGLPVLDLNLLGFGEDGHTASLFPGFDTIDITDRLTAVVHDSPKPPPTRITLTLPVLRAARRIAFLVEGAGKAGPVAQLMRGPDRAMPSSLLGSDHTVVISDEAAAADVAS